MTSLLYKPHADWDTHVIAAAQLFPKLVFCQGGCYASGFKSAAEAVAAQKGHPKLFQVKSPSRDSIQVNIVFNSRVQPSL